MDVCLKDNSLKGACELQMLLRLGCPQTWAGKCPGGMGAAQH